MGTVSIGLPIASADPDPTNTPELVFVAGTNYPLGGYAFPQSSSKAVYINFSALSYGGGNVTLVVKWYSRSGSTTGSVTWSAALEAISPGDAQSVETKAFATAQTTTTTVNATAKGETSTTITISNLDSLANADDVRIKLTRTDTSMVGDAIAMWADISYSDGNSGTPGSGDFVGPASSTDTALVRFSGTTGKLGQNSPITCDASGNLAGVASLNAGFIMPSMARLTATSTTSGTALTDITNLTLTVPAAGSYSFEFSLGVSASSTSNAVAFAVNVTGGTISNYGMLVEHGTNTTAQTNGFQATNNTATASAANAAGATVMPTWLSGTFTCTASGSVVPRFSIATSGTATAAVGSWGRLVRIA